MVFAGIKVPDTTLVRDAIDLSRSLLEPYLFNHVMRSWLFGVLLSEGAERSPEAGDHHRQHPSGFRRPVRRGVHASELRRSGRRRTIFRIVAPPIDEHSKHRPSQPSWREEGGAANNSVNDMGPYDRLTLRPGNGNFITGARHHAIVLRKHLIHSPGNLGQRVVPRKVRP